MYTEHLGTAQTVARALLRNDIAEQGYAILKAGMRSGKNLLVCAVAETDYENIAVFSHTVGYARDIIHDSWEVSTKNFFNRFPEGAEITADTSKTLVVLDDVFWREESLAQFEEAIRLGYKVLAVGSNGPQFPRWQHLGGHGYNTWDLHPTLTEAGLAHLFAKAAEKSKRDYCAF